METSVTVILVPPKCFQLVAIGAYVLGEVCRCRRLVAGNDRGGVALHHSSGSGLVQLRRFPAAEHRCKRENHKSRDHTENNDESS